MNEMLFHDLLHQPHKGIYALKIFIPAIRFLNNQFNCILMDVPVIKCRSSSLYSNRGIRAKAYPAHFIQIHSYIHLCFFSVFNDFDFRVLLKKGRYKNHSNCNKNTIFYDISTIMLDCNKSLSLFL